MKRKRLKKRSPFAQELSDKWYDLEYDRELIVQSVAKQYGLLPSEQEEMSYSEWLLLVGGIMEDTPLGQTVLI
nr:bacteriophage Gp15 family protein [Ruminococcus sp.]